jgi:predicted DNA-binding mobile mystery protein A
MKSDMRRRARQRLDDRLLALKPEDRFRPPPKGWIRAIRDALGMSGVQLASRLGVRPQTVEAIEKSEASGSIQLNTLRRAAAAVDCTLVPKTSLDEGVNQPARKIAVCDLQGVAHTMKPEAQATGNAEREARIEVYIRDVIKDRELWNEP